jgi:hypothetical protein
VLGFQSNKQLVGMGPVLRQALSSLKVGDQLQVCRTPGLGLVEVRNAVDVDTEVRAELTDRELGALRRSELQGQ